jgi:hypothetical protein
MDAWPGTRAMPVCTIAQGLMKLTADKRAIRIMPAEYDPVTIMITGAVTLYGSAGEGGATKITSRSDMADAVAVSGMSDVTLDGVELTGLRSGLACNGPTAKLTLRRSRVVEALQVGVSINECNNVVLDRTMVSGNRNGAIRFVKANGFAVTNSFIVDNRGTSALSIDVESQGKVRFSTIAGNRAPIAGALNCDAANCTLEDTIVFDNSLSMGSQFSAPGALTLTSTVVGMADMTTGMGAVKKNPALLPDYRLQADAPANNECCINQAQGTIDVDFFGTRRPLGGRPDIGAHEAR